MSVTDATSSRVVADEVASAEWRRAPASATDRPFERLKDLAASLLHARTILVVLDPPPDGGADQIALANDSDDAPAEVRALARLARGRGGNGTFIADASTHSWISDALTLARLGSIACAAVPLVMSEGTVVGCLCVLCHQPREWTRDEEVLLIDIAGEIAARVEMRRAQRIERRRAAEAVGRMQLLDTILSTSADHLFVLDRSARYTYVSRAGAQSLGKTPAEMMGRTLGELGFPRELTEPLEQQVRSVFLTGGSATGEAQLELPDGPRSLEHVFSPVFGPTGRVDAVVVTVRDITGRKAMELHLREAKTSAEREAVVKDQFLAALSHELRTPLTPVLATVSALAGDASLPEHVRGAVGMIRRNVELQTRLIDDLLDLTRIARGKIALKIDAVDLLAAVHEAAEMVAADAQTKGVKLVLPPKEHTASRYVRGDGARMRQVLWNLLKNAVKFTPADGEVAVAVDPDEQGQRVSVAVKDTGIGIPAHAIDRIFLPFEQGDPTTSRRFGGLGLGLAISKALVELQGGQLTARSGGVNRGSTFTLNLQAAPPPPPGAPPHPSAVPASAPPRRLRVLLVDDHEDTRNALRRLLVDHDVRTAGSVNEALEEAALYGFDLLVSDIGLPDGNGLDLMQQLRARYNMKGIALSGYGMGDDVRRSLGAGFHAHLTKPISAEALLDAIAQVTAEATPGDSTAPV